jgi:3-dehydroquinate synthase
LPTTSVAQGDSGIGVKNGINFAGQKNYLGTFAPPTGVLCDLQFLRTLEAGLLNDGLAEAVKVAMIKDAEFFEILEEQSSEVANRNWPIIESIIQKCGEIHYRHIATTGDPFERGTARPLDFGHWAGHRLEKISDYTIRHGEGVAMGIALDTTYAHLSGILSRSECERVFSLLQRLQLPLYHRLMEKQTEDGKLEILLGLEQFREHLGGELSIPMPSKLGEAIEIHRIEHERLRQAVAMLRDRHQMSPY